MRVGCLAALLAVAASALSWLGRNYSGEFGTMDADEPAHYVTGLLIHDYLAKGFPARPIDFAANYYLHYPKVALGVWPPFFHIIEAVWMLAFSPLRDSVLLLMVFINVVSAVTLFLVARKPLGPRLALFAAFSYIALPEVQVVSGSVFADGLVAALELLAVIQLARYADTEKPAYAYGFGLLATLGALTKANALALLFVPAIMLGLSAKWRLLRRKEVWLALLMVLVAAAPWNYFLGRVAIGSIGLVHTDLKSVVHRTATVLHWIVLGPGVFLPFAAVGVWQRIVRPLRSGQVGAIWASNMALILAVCLFHVVVPATGIPQRYLLPLLAPMLLFAMAGVESVARIVPPARWSVGWRTAAVATLSAAAFLSFQFRIARKPSAGFQPTAERLARDPTPRVVLVCGDGLEEGMVVSEIAMRDARPRQFVLRASKVLAQSDWNGQGYRPLFLSAQQIAGYLDWVPVDYVLIDATGRYAAAHRQLLAEALRSHSETWERGPSAGDLLQLWRRVRPLSHGEPRITIGMTYTLHRSLSNEKGIRDR